MSRCWGCCQENCGYTQCSCDCHERNERAREAVESRKKDPPVQDLRAYGHINLPTCERHRRYKGLRRPRTACEGCWRRWIALNPA